MTYSMSGLSHKTETVKGFSCDLQYEWPQAKDRDCQRPTFSRLRSQLTIQEACRDLVDLNDSKTSDGAPLHDSLSSGGGGGGGGGGGVDKSRDIWYSNFMKMARALHA